MPRLTGKLTSHVDYVNYALRVCLRVDYLSPRKERKNANVISEAEPLDLTTDLSTFGLIYLICK